MYEQLVRWLSHYGLTQNDWQVEAIMIALIALTIVIIHCILYVLFRIVFKRFSQSKSIFFNELADKSLLNNFGYAIQGILLSLQLRIWLPESTWQEGLIVLTDIWTLIFSLFTLFSLLNALHRYLLSKEIAKQFPVTGIIQTIKLIASLGLSIILISLILGKSPLILLSGLGAMTAVLMLVFKDPILGFVAGIQLSANRMLNIGDWLEMPKYHADGSVVDIGLTTVKVQNWDNTVTTIPTYALISDSFKNWRAMSESGGRRIKRALYIDTTSVHFLSNEEIEHLSQSRLLTDYLATRLKEIQEFNQTHEISGNSPLNGRHLTNLGTFRVYLENYLKTNPSIHRNMTLMVRQLAPDEKGIPLEIYCFTNTVAWTEYEAIQSDIFDHIVAVIGEFGLRIYQAPSGQDLRHILDNGKNIVVTK